MAIEGVPWFPGQAGADVSAEVARLLAYGLGHGILAPEALKVTALPTPGAAVRILPGPAAIEHRGVGGAYQAYVALGKTATDQGVAATGSSGGSSSLVVLRVEDPTMPGEGHQVPADVANGPYVFARLIPCGATTTELAQVAGYEGATAVTLARIDQPANTATITQAMITDLRRLAKPMEQRHHVPRPAASPTSTLQSSTEVVWPPNTDTIDIPKWATRLQGVVSINQMEQRLGNEFTQHRVRIGSSLFSTSTYSDTDGGPNDIQRLSVEIGVDVEIPPAMRGTRQQVAVMSRRMGSESGRYTATTGTQLIVDLTSKASPI